MSNLYDFMLKFKGVIFDLDGTLVDSMPLHLKAWHRALAHFKVDIDDDFLLAHGGVPSQKIAAILLDRFQIKQVTPTKLAQIKTDYYIETLADVEFFPQVRVMLATLKANGIRMAVGTGTTAYNMHHILSQTELKDYIEVGVCAEDVEHHKPEPDTFLEAARRIDCLPEETLVAEDTPLGITAAHRGGFHALFMKRGDLVTLTSAQGEVLASWSN